MHGLGRALVGFAPIVVATGPPAPVRDGGNALYHDPATRNSCAGMAPTCPGDAPYRYGNDDAGWYCCQDAAGAKAEDCKTASGMCCLAPGHTLGCQGHPVCAKHTWTEYGNDCAGWYCSLDAPTTTEFCARPDICSGCPNTAQCRSNCTGSGQLSHASCDCVDNGGVCRLLSRGEELSSSAGAEGQDIPVCVAAAANAQNLTEGIKKSLRLKQTVFAASAGMATTSTLVVYMQLELSLAAGFVAGAAGGLSVAATLAGSSKTAVRWPAQPLRAGGSTLTFAAAVDVADSVGQSRMIPISEFASNQSMAASYWQTKLAKATGPEIEEQRVSTAWKAWLANSFLHVRRGAGQGPNGSDLLYPQDGILFYEAIFGYSAALYASMLTRYGYSDHAVSYIDSMLAMVQPDGLFTLNFGLPDHGALLLAISDYVLTSRNTKWLESKATEINHMVSWVCTERAASMANQTAGSPIYGLIFYRPYCDHPAPTYSYLSDTCPLHSMLLLSTDRFFIGILYCFERRPMVLLSTDRFCIGILCAFLTPDQGDSFPVE